MSMHPKKLTLPTLKGVEDGKDVVRWHPQRTAGKEGKTPCDAQQAGQTKYRHHFLGAQAEPAGVRLWALEVDHPTQYDDKCNKCKHEDHRIVANVYNVVDIRISYPAPWYWIKERNVK